MTASSFRPHSIAEIARRATAAGEQRFFPATREFLDTWQGLSAAERPEALAVEPEPVGEVEDAYLGALAEHLAAVERMERLHGPKRPDDSCRVPISRADWNR